MSPPPSRKTQALARRVLQGKVRCHACRERIVIVEDGPEAFINTVPEAFHLDCAKRAGVY